MQDSTGSLSKLELVPGVRASGGRAAMADWETERERVASVVRGAGVLSEAGACATR